MKLLNELIAINSISGHEEKIQQYIMSYLKKLGFVPVFYKGNVIVKIVGLEERNALIFNAHVDTVSVGDRSAWIYDPFSGTKIGNKIYGLGASDEKASVVTLLLLAKRLSMNKPSCTVFLTFVTQEETDGSGTKHVMQWFMKNERKKFINVAGILGEPTGLTEIEIAHKGNIFLSITTIGESGHGSDPDAISSHAVLEMITIMKKLQLLQKVWKKKYTDALFGYPTIGLATSIQAGDSSSPNKFPDRCTVTCDIRTTPQMHKMAIKEITQISSPAKVEYVYPPVSFGYTKPDETIIAIGKEITGAHVIASAWSNDMCFFTEMNIPAIVFGPGERQVIHKANEYCYEEKITQCIQYYKELIDAYTKK